METGTDYDADGSLDRVARSLNTVAYRRLGLAPWQVERVWGDTEHILGCSASDATGVNAKPQISPEDQRRLDRAHGSILALGDSADVVVKVHRCDGCVVAVAEHSWGVFDNEGSLQALEGYIVLLDRSDARTLLMQGFVHDLNNILSAAMYGARCGREMAEGNGTLAEALAGTEKAIQSASDLTAQIARLGAPSGIGVAVVDDVVREMLPLLHCILRAGVELSTDLRAGGAAVALCPEDLERILLNLAMNAREALPDGGLVSVRTSLRVCGAAQWVRLEVADTGRGVSPDSLTSLTKDGVSSKVRGSGLGLGIVRGLVASGGGSLEVSSQEEGGATFSVALPAVGDEARMGGA